MTTNDLNQIPQADILRQMYLDLIKRSLLNLIYPENELRVMYLKQCLAGSTPADPIVLRDIRYVAKEAYQKFIACRKEGQFFPGHLTEFCHSMIGLQRMDNIQFCAEQIFQDKIPGDFVETGIWRGGAVIFMRALLKAYQEDDSRYVWAADSFEGLPKPQILQDTGYDLSKSRFPFLAISLECVQDNFRTYNLLDDRVKFLKGWFEDTIPIAPIEQISLLRLDGDLYKSTMDVLNPLYDKVSPGGYIIVDDYNDIEPCRRAVDEFRTSRQITDPLVDIDWTGVFWRKSR